MDNKAKLLRRLIALVIVLVTLCGLASAGLYSLQIINGEQYREQAERHLTTTSVVSAARGEILDRYGRPLVTNQSVYSIRLDYAYWDHENQNDILLQLVQLIVSSGRAMPTALPITKEEPYAFTCSETDSAYTTLMNYLNGRKDSMALKTRYGVTKAEQLDAGQVLDALKAYYKINPSYAAGNARAILDQRYRMDIKQFSRYNPFILIEDVSMDLIAKIKERHAVFQGVNVETSSKRVYETDYAAQLLGRTGVIYKEDWSEGENYKAQGYSMNDIVGKNGVEYAFEKYLRGKSGSRLVDTDVSGEVTGTMEAVAPQPGNNVVLTLDIELQKVTEQSLAEHISKISTARGAAAVVLDVHSGEVLAAANYPTFSQRTFNETYKTDFEDPLKPHTNRAFQGVYPPGSTFKPMVAIAGLEEGVIRPDTLMTCNHYYTRFQSRTFTCLGWHGQEDLTKAIQKSCNIYFYETGFLLGGAKLEQWAHKFGFGEKTGIELGEASGSASGPENRAKMLEAVPTYNKWMPGDVVQSAIGQGDNTMTPLQLANYAAIIANGGIRYQPTILKNVKSYDYSRTIIDPDPTVALDLELDPDNLKIVQKAMQAVAEEGGTAARTFANYPIPIAAKTGTAQHAATKDLEYNGEDHAVFVGYAPADDPQIAIAIVGECAGHGSEMAPIARDIFDAYFQGEDAVDTVAQENVLQP